MAQTSKIPSEMRAVKVHGPHDYRLEKVKTPKPAPGEILMQVEAVGVCASDLKCWHGAEKFWGNAAQGRPSWVQKGITAGHEIAGTIVAGDETGLKYHGLSIGDRVTVEQIVPCKTCRYCKKGSYHMCLVHDMFGFKTFDGGMADYMVIPQRALLHKISPSLHPYHAAYAEPLSCSLHAVERANIKFNDVVVVAGAGPLGLGCCIGAKTKGALKVVALDLSDKKLAIAKKVGADVVINVKTQNAREIINSMTDGYGCDVYIEATGHPSAVQQGLDLLCKCGTFVEYSVFKDPVTVDWSIISDDKALDVFGAHLGPHAWPQAVKLLEQGHLPLDDICTHQFPLEKFEEAFKLVADFAGGSVKVSLVPSLAA